MSTYTAVIPPTTAVVPGGAASCAMVRSGPRTVLIAAPDSGAEDSVTWK
jgi:hypothetical protein